MALNATKVRSTGYIPYRLMLRREVILTVNFVTGMTNLTLTDRKVGETSRNGYGGSSFIC